MRLYSAFLHLRLIFFMFLKNVIFTLINPFFWNTHSTGDYSQLFRITDPANFYLDLCMPPSSLQTG